MFVLACKAAGATFSLGYADVGEAERVGPALATLRDAAVDNVAGQSRPDGALGIKGVAPNPASARLRIAGQLPSGQPAQLAAAFFSRGTRVFQASVVSEGRLDPEAVDTFFAGISLTG